MCSGSLIAVVLTALFGCSEPTGNPAAKPESAGELPRRHCQVPCGIYGDKMRIDMLMEDAATIEKGMKMIKQIEASDGQNRNQLVRWVMNKDQHATAIQNTVAQYWLAQRVKEPKTDDIASWKKYREQLHLMHKITVLAMKCKQTVDAAHVKAMREAAMLFSKAYFKPEDLKHLQGHHGHGHEHKKHK